MGKVLKKPMSSRVVWMDLLRIFSIFAMITIHVAASGFNQPVKEFNFSVMNFYNSISRFCVPVFVMLSGAMMLDPKRELSLKKLFLHNTLRIVTAFVFWSAIYAVYGFITTGKELNLVNIKELVKTTMAGEYHMWFLFALVGLYLLTPVLRMIAANKKATEYFLILCLIFVFILPYIFMTYYVPKEVKDIVPKLTLDFLKGYPVYFLAGYYFKENPPKKLVKWCVYALGIASSGLIYFNTAEMSIKNGTPDNPLYSYFSLPTALQTLAVFTFFACELSRINFKDLSKKIIIKLSALSFGAYLCHVLFLILLSKAGLTSVTFNPIISVPLKAAATFICAFVLTYLISLIPFVKKYII